MNTIIASKKKVKQMKEMKEKKIKDISINTQSKESISLSKENDNDNNTETNKNTISENRNSCDTCNKCQKYEKEIQNCMIFINILNLFFYIIYCSIWIIISCCMMDYNFVFMMIKVIRIN